MRRDPAADTADPDDQAKFSGPALPVGTRLALSALDPRNVTLEPEY